MLAIPMASVLLVCTGNVCRSPLAEGLVRATLVRRFGDAAPVVSSAGTAAWDGSPPMTESVEAGAELGVDISRQTARQLTSDMIERSDLLLGMGAEHRTAVVRAVPDAASRTFEFKELVRLLETLPAADPAIEPGRALLERAAEANGLRRKGVRGQPGSGDRAEDFRDPLGMPLETFRSLAEEIFAWSERLADGLFGKIRAGTAPSGGT